MLIIQINIKKNMHLRNSQTIEKQIHIYFKLYFNKYEMRGMLERKNFLYQKMNTLLSTTILKHTQKQITTITKILYKQ